MVLKRNRRFALPIERKFSVFRLEKKRPLSTKRLDPSEIPRIVDQEGKHQIKIQKKRREIGE